jgi:hypothetical protein
MGLKLGAVGATEQVASQPIDLGAMNQLALENQEMAQRPEEINYFRLGSSKVTAHGEYLFPWIIRSVLIQFPCFPFV